MYRIDGDPDRIIIGEGFATLASIHEATGATVIIAFDAGNLLAVAEAVRKQFHDTDVIIAADDDWKTKGNPGRAKATEAARAIGARLAIPDFGANRRDKDTDFNDLANFIGPDAVRRCIDAAEEQSIDVEAEIPRLAKLSIVEYEREREQVAKRLGMRVSVLDAEVALKRDKPTKSKEGISRQHWKVEPWAEPVDLAELLDAIHGQITRYMKMPETEVVAVTLWVAHTWVFDAMDVSPYMNIRSPAPECGKSRLLKLIYFMGHRTYTTGNISPAAIFRVIDEWHPTLLIDEVDTFLKENEEARGILDAGHTRATAFVTRIVDEKGQLVPKDFSTWAPKVFCGIGEIARTLAGRSVIVELQRKKIGEKLPRLLERDVEAFADIRSKAARWAQDALPALQKADTEDSIAVPEALSDRATDNWRPLLAIADLACDGWPGRARNAVLALSGIRGSEDIAIQLLRHIRDAFLRRDDQGNVILQLKALKTEDLLAHLTADPERPWAEYRRGKPLSATATRCPTWEVWDHLGNGQFPWPGRREGLQTGPFRGRMGTVSACRFLPQCKPRSGC
jgi:putative DNA primase/helicase